MKDSMLPSLGLIKWTAISLVVLALAVLAVTNWFASQAKALRVAETRNLQQWGIAFNLYLIENDNQLPEVGSAPITLDQRRAWFNVLPPYISATPLAELQPESRPRPGVPSLWVRPSTKPVKIWDLSAFFFTYGMNRFLQPDPAVRSFRIYELSFPGSVIFLTPTNGFVPSSDPGTVVFPAGKDPEVPVLFCDGHVSPVRKSVLLDPAAGGVPTSAESVSWFKD